MAHCHGFRGGTATMECCLLRIDYGILSLFGCLHRTRGCLQQFYSSIDDNIHDEHGHYKRIKFEGNTSNLPQSTT